MSILSEMHIYDDAKRFCLYASSAKFDQLTSSSSFYYVPFVKRIYKPIYSRSINKFCRHIQNEDEIKDILVYLSTNDFHDDGQLPMNVLKEDLCTYKDGKIITQKTDGRELDYDPSEGKDWHWEDYE